jgi:hypothetical protein
MSEKGWEAEARQRDDSAAQHKQLVSYTERFHPLPPVNRRHSVAHLTQRFFLVARLMK